LIPPTRSKSDKPIEYAPPSEDPYMGGDAPSIKNIIRGKSAKRVIGSTSQRPSKKSKTTSVDAPTAAAILAKAIQKTIPEIQPETGFNFSFPILIFIRFYLSLVYFVEQNTGDKTGLNSPHVSRPNSPELSASVPDPIGNIRSPTFIIQETFYF